MRYFDLPPRGAEIAEPARIILLAGVRTERFCRLEWLPPGWPHAEPFLKQERNRAVLGLFFVVPIADDDVLGDKRGRALCVIPGGFPFGKAQLLGILKTVSPH